MHKEERIIFIQETFKLIKEPMSWCNGEGFILNLIPQITIRNEIIKELENTKIEDIENKVVMLTSGEGLWIVIQYNFFKTDDELEKTCTTIKNYIFKSLPFYTRTQQELDEIIQNKKAKELKIKQLREKIKTDPELLEIYDLGFSDCLNEHKNRRL